MNLWLQAIYLMFASKKGISSNQLHRSLGVTLKTAWFMSHRIREAMGEVSGVSLDSGSRAVEVDEANISGETSTETKYAFHHQMKALCLNYREAAKMIGQASWLRPVGKEFSSHKAVDHEREMFARGNFHTTGIKGYYSIFKLGVKGVPQCCGRKYLLRYMAEFDFRYINRNASSICDSQRTADVLCCLMSKRLTNKLSD